MFHRNSTDVVFEWIIPSRIGLTPPHLESIWVIVELSVTLAILRTVVATRTRTETGIIAATVIGTVTTMAGTTETAETGATAVALHAGTHQITAGAGAIRAARLEEAARRKPRIMKQTVGKYSVHPKVEDKARTRTRTWEGQWLQSRSGGPRLSSSHFKLSPSFLPNVEHRGRLSIATKQKCQVIKLSSHQVVLVIVLVRALSAYYNCKYTRLLLSICLPGRMQRVMSSLSCSCRLIRRRFLLCGSTGARTTRFDGVNSLLCIFRCLRSAM